MHRQAALKRLKDKLAARNVKVAERIETKAPQSAHRYEWVEKGVSERA
jgi:hypothetical protein